MTQLNSTSLAESERAPSRAERLVMTSVRMDRDLHQALRRIAFDRRQSLHSLHSLLIEGAREMCQRYQDPSAAGAD